jgi:hypothetical protein
MQPDPDNPGSSVTSLPYLPVEYRVVGQEDVYLSGVFAGGNLYESDFVTQVAVGASVGNAIAESIRAVQPALDIAQNVAGEFLIETLDQVPCSPLNGDIPSLTDPRWGNIELPFPCRTIYITITDLFLENLLSVAGCSFYAYIEADGEITQINSDIAYSHQGRRNTKNFIFNSVLARSVTNFRMLVEFVSTDLNAAHNVLVVDGDVLSVGPNQQSFAASIRSGQQVKIRLNYDRNGSPTMGSFAGIQGAVSGYDPETNSISWDWEGFSPSQGDRVRIYSIATNAVAPAGVTFVGEPKTVDVFNNTILLTGAYPPPLNSPMRIRVFSGTFSGCTNGQLVTIRSAVARGNNQYLCRLARNSQITFDDRGTVGTNRFIYLTPLESPEFTLLSNNRLSLDGINPLDLFMEHEAIGICSAGSVSTVTVAGGHNLEVGELVEFGLASVAGAAYPSPMNASSTCFFVHSIVSPTVFTMAQSVGGATAVFSTTGSGVTVTKVSDNTTMACTVQTGTAAVFQIGSHGLAVGSRIWFSGTVPSPIVSTRPYYILTVSTTAPGSVTLSDIPNGVPIGLFEASTGVTVRGTNTAVGNEPPMIGLSEYLLINGDRSGEFKLLSAFNEDLIQINSANGTALSIAGVDPILVSGKIYMRGFR